jgi:hypothetical protein
MVQSLLQTGGILSFRKAIVAALALFAFTNPALAGSAPSGQLHSFIFAEDGIVLVWSTRAQVGAPSCATTPNRWVIDASTPGGKSVLAGLLSAYALGKPVVILGRGDCVHGWASEAISSFYTDDWVTPAP